MKLALRLLSVLLIPILLAVVGGAVWGLVDWLRNYGSADVSPFPYFDHSASGWEFHKRYASNTFFGLVETGINWYNLTFKGGTRFGSGLGFIAGSFIAMGFFKDQKTLFRITSGALAGAAIGSRFVLNLGSGVPLFLTGLAVGALIGAIYMGIGAAPSRSKKLPTKDLAKIS